MDPLNPAANNGPVSDTPSDPASDVSGTESVSEGYSSTDSVSYTETESAAAMEPDSAVELDSPDGSSSSSADYLQRTFDARLTSFRTIISDFNARFSAEDVDLADTQTLLMVMKGIVSDNRALLSAETIGQVSTSRVINSQRRQAAIKDQVSVSKDLSTQQSTIDQTNEQLTAKNAGLTASQASLQAKQQQLEAVLDAVDSSTPAAPASSDGTTEPDEGSDEASVDDPSTSDVAGGTPAADTSSSTEPPEAALLRSEIETIQELISVLEHQISALQADVEQLQAQASVKQDQLDSIKTTLILTSEEFFDEFVKVRQEVAKVIERYDPAVLETGEDSRAELETDNQVTEKAQSREEERVHSLQREIRKIDDEVVGEQIKLSDARADENLLNPELTGLSNNQLETLSTLFPPGIRRLFCSNYGISGTANRRAA